VRNGCDLNCGDIYPRLLEAVGHGLVTEEEITRSVERLFTARFKLGMFDALEEVPWSQLPPEIVNCPQHRRLSRQAARESMVLLKNENGLLPLRKDVHSILVVGPNACAMDVLLGNYNGHAPQLTTLLEGITGAVSAGSKVTWCAGKDPADLAWHLAGVDVVIACLGFTPEMEGEEMGDMGVAGEGGGDRLSIGLPGKQSDLLRTLHASGIPVVLVLTGGGPIELNWAHEHIPAILMAWYPGEAGGHALADILFGDYNPAGRLPVTFIKSLDDIPAFTDYQMQGRTYRFMEKDPLYPFGHGLSYSTFEYSKLTVKGLRVKVDVLNTGLRDGDEVVQVYVSHLAAAGPVPVRQLVGCKRVHLRRGERKSVTFRLDRGSFAAYDERGQPVMEPGEFLIHAGGGQAGGVTQQVVL
jgi:beta-glucosidase